MKKDELVTITLPRYLYDMERKMRFFEPDKSHKYSKNKYNIFIGISISNKKISPRMVYNYLRWATQNTKDKVVVIIADELNIVNYEIFDKYSSGKARNRAKKVGNEFEKLFLRGIKELPLEHQNKIQIYKWPDVKTKNYNVIRDILQEAYYKDYEFKSAVLFFVKKYMRKKGKIIHDPEKIDKLARYVIGELPTLLGGIEIDGTKYNLCIYPTYFASGMSQLVMDIHNDELGISKKLKNVLKDKAILVEAWLD
ncbi:tRNA-dependent cyclodipeptide synthase [Candidatus Pacearchaeota archaeon]|nr:tRNA-dependent cyclodipeptide synthase [Candidatus Pacearchaeota archaeon]